MTEPAGNTQRRGVVSWSVRLMPERSTELFEGL